MSQVNDKTKVTITMNGTKIQVSPGQHSFQDLISASGLTPATKQLTITDQAPRSAFVVNPNHSVTISGGEVITSA